ncbi:formylglycine-generating enzyme required for sulfatase activity [Desulfobotulus alkaliphilus]|uniref:Formylglycine-generating enzyme required for sulfatase activity n=1 Tax=Desulfobotulus alkaliphilus TaxID=622671 RepID=A0A562RVJ8_9BACT|nr:formylglycine-generating enzyme family protein [Desulfobotulus alkaliphilus]TWI72450.1 formylglycine-generating enzyme required for sulfatase activity [Desulfobotulus alkaliphilus]
MVLRQIFTCILFFSFLTLPVFGWMDESFIPVWEDNYRIGGSVSGDKITNSLGMTFVKIPAGEFWMGSPSNEPGRFDDEKRHRVKISKDFYMMTTEVTQAQWERVMGSNPSRFKNCGKDCPVEQVSWNDVQEFIKKLNAMDKTLTVRLPTEAEWEYAARAGTDTPFAFGTCLSTSDANYDGNYPLSGCPKGSYRKTTVKVASFKPNAWGLYDMHGNVWEWVQDVYKKDYETLPKTDPIYASSAGGSRVVRGGGWYSIARRCRSANRSRYGADYRGNVLGFRLAGS